jgi:hypothetical protein
MVFMSPMQVMAARRIALMLDPAGSFHGLWQPGGMAGFAVMNEPGAPGWFDHASSKPAAATYYSALLGADLVGPDDSMRILARGGEWFVSTTDQGDSPEPPH